MRKTSDEICRERQLSIVERPRNRRMHYTEWKAEQQGQRTWRTAIREDLDKAIKASMTWSAFVRTLKERGYEVKSNVKHVAVRPPGKERFVRLRSLGDNYTEEAIKQRILKQRTPAYPAKAETRTVLRIKVRGDFRLSKITWKGLRALYFFYRRKLKEAQRQPEGYAPYLLRDDLRQLDRINEQTAFLFQHKLDTLEQLKAYREDTKTEIDRLLKERGRLNNEKRRVDTSQERKGEIAGAVKEVSQQLKALRKEERLCSRIEERSVEIALKREQLKKQDLYCTMDTSREHKSDIVRKRDLGKSI